MNYKLGFIGVGNMGGALLRAALKTVPADDIAISGRDPIKTHNIAKELDCAAIDANGLAASSKYIFLGVKPQSMESVLKGIAGVLSARTDRFILVSMAAGLSMKTIRNMAGGDYPIIRIMPNTPVSVGEGMILYDTTDVAPDEETSFLEYMSGSGKFDRLSENYIDAGCALSGCGPAFVYMFIEALADGAVSCGLPRAKAIEYAAQTCLGASKLVLNSDKHPGELKDAVCSPGGSTIQGVRALEENSFRSAAIEAVIAAYEKTKSLG